MDTNSKGATIQELLELASGEIVSVEERNEAELYFDENEVYSGTNNIDDRIVYWNYLKWCQTINRIPVDRVTFIRAAQRRFKRFRGKGKGYFKLLDKEKFTVSKQEWEEILRDYNNEQRHITWRKNIKIAQRARRKREKEARKRNKVVQEKTPPNTQD